MYPVGRSTVILQIAVLIFVLLISGIPESVIFYRLHASEFLQRHFCDPACGLRFFFIRQIAETDFLVIYHKNAGICHFFHFNRPLSDKLYVHLFVLVDYMYFLNLFSHTLNKEMIK